MSEKIRKLKTLVPSVYKDVTEMDTIIGTEQKLFDKTQEYLQGGILNTFIPTSTLENEGIQRFEKLLEISPKSGETEEFRRDRVYERWNWKPPYTIKYLRNVLDRLIGPGYIRQNESEAIGEGAYEMWVEYNEYNLMISCNQPEQPWAEEVTFFIKSIRPCNLTFLRRASFPPQGIKLSEEIYVDRGTWNYVLGEWSLGDEDESGTILPFLSQHDDIRTWNYKMEGWPVGRDPFASLLEGDIIKMAATSSLTVDLIKQDASYIASIIWKVVINEGMDDEFEIPREDFDVIDRLGTEAILIYSVDSIKTRLIQTISIYNEEDTLLSKSTVAVPVDDRVQAKHRIYVKEAV